MNKCEKTSHPYSAKIRKMHLPALFTAVSLALLFHMAMLIFLKDIRIDFTSEVKPLIENQSSPNRDEVKSPPEDADKQRQLAEVLNQIYLQTSPQKMEEETGEHHPELAQDMENIEADLKVLDTPSELSDSEMGSSHPLPEALQAATPSPGEEALSSKFLRRPTDIDILFPNDEYLVDELIMATEMAYGHLAPEEIDELDSQNAIKAGHEDVTSKGNSMQNRSGLWDKNFADSIVNSGGSFNLSSVVGNWNFSALKSTSNFQSRDALLPRSNKNELRGFDYKSLGTIAGSNDFTLNVEYAPRKEGGYLFRLELVPKEQVKFKHIKQNFFFLIDRSHSIRYNRYEINKVAVAKALALLQKEDTFNILVFDDAITRLSAQNLPWNAGNVSQARDFILQQPYGGLFANTDLYSSLGLIVPSDVAENEVNTAILLSDGDTFLSLEKQRNSIGTWTHKNAGKVSLYTLASGKGNNLALLDILSVFNKGALQFSPTDKGIEGVLFNLIKSVRNPIGKDITITILPSAPDLDITIYPAKQYLPNLYENTPYVVYGFVNQLKDFHIFYQGKYYDKLLDIKQEVSFKKGSKIDSEVLAKKIALQKAYAAYHDYLYDGQPQHLNDAKQLLAPYRIPLAFK